MPVLVFDMGGTLMEYKGMPLSWAGYYHQGFQRIADDLHYSISEETLEKSVSIMKGFNPRLQYRETEFTPEYIFHQVLEHWEIQGNIKDMINCFFSGLPLIAEIYADSIPALAALEAKGVETAALTDLPAAMPDEWFRKDVEELLGHIGFYVSSQSCGYRKPNPYGLHRIANHYHVPVRELVLIGDEEKDRLTAQNAGCKFIQIDRTGKIPGADIKSLEELWGLCHI